MRKSTLDPIQFSKPDSPGGPIPSAVIPLQQGCLPVPGLPPPLRIWNFYPG